MTDLEERLVAKKAGVGTAAKELQARLNQARQQRQLCHYRLLALEDELEGVRETYHAVCGTVAALEMAAKLVEEGKGQGGGSGTSDQGQPVSEVEGGV